MHFVVCLSVKLYFYLLMKSISYFLKLERNIEYDAAPIHSHKIQKLRLYKVEYTF